MKLEFKNKFTLIGGAEYFAGDERLMKKLFNYICDLHDSAYSIFYDNPDTNSPQFTTLQSEPNIIIPTNNIQHIQHIQNITNIHSTEIEKGAEITETNFKVST